MRKLKTTVLLFALCAAAVLLPSCNDDDNGPSNEPQTEYTLMLYGCGGGNLDDFMKLNLQQAVLTGSNDKVKMTGQVKFSAEYQSDPDLKGTRRFILRDEDGDQECDAVEMLDASLPLYEPDNLADFIRWSKQQCPAKNYILILWNHGNGWYPVSDNPKTRGILQDDNADDLMMSLDELVEGVKRSDTHLKMIYYDACLMAMLENLCGLTEVTDYVLGAAHITPGLGGDYASLIENLTLASDLETAIKRYCREVMAHWSVYPGNFDISLTDLSRLTPVTTALREISEELVNSYADYDEEYNQATCSCYRLDSSYPFFDVMDYVQTLAVAAENPRLIALASELHRATDAAIVCRETSKKLYPQDISWGITLVNDATWESLYADGAYRTLAFDKASGWSNWLQVNKQRPTGNPAAKMGMNNDF